jgi:hypothetical protein
MRSYGPAAADQTVFLELKKKYKGIVYKRRISVPEQTAADFLQRRLAPLPEDSQIGREISVLPVVLRESGSGRAPELRPQASLPPTIPACASPSTGHPLAHRGLSLTPSPAASRFSARSSPSWRSRPAARCRCGWTELLDAQGIRQTSFSKYGTAYESMLQNDFRRKEVFSVLNSIFSSPLYRASGTHHPDRSFLISIAAALVLGAILTFVYTYKDIIPRASP